MSRISHPRVRNAEVNMASRLAWVDNYLGTFVAAYAPPPDKSKMETSQHYADLVHHPKLTEPLDDITIFVPTNMGNKRYLAPLVLTYLNPDELSSLKTLIDLAFSEATSICEERLRVAKENTENGMPFYSRMYRNSSRLHLGLGMEAHLQRKEDYFSEESREAGEGDEESGGK